VAVLLTAEHRSKIGQLFIDCLVTASRENKTQVYNRWLYIDCIDV